jgi:hypothetical protein
MAEQSPPARDVVERHLERAWGSFAPDASLQERVRARLTSSTAATMGAIGTGAALRVRPEGTWASLQGSSKLGAALVGAGLLGIGLLSGYLIRDRREEPAPPSLPAVVSVPSSASSPPELLLAPNPLPAWAIEAPAVVPAQAPAPRAERPLRQRAKASAPAAVEPSEELALLRRAERAVRSDDSALALALIGELEERYPRSSLLEERRAIELLAYCVAGASDARARARRFLREHPSSVYRGRIAEKCAEAGELSPTAR